MAEDKALLARLDLAIDKLSDVSADIKAVLAVHESKFENQENLKQHMAKPSERKLPLASSRKALGLNTNIPMAEELEQSSHGSD